MTITRGTLYAGVFLLAAGAVTLAAAANVIDRTATANAVAALWSLAVIAIGVGLVLRRSPAALVAGILAAAVPGLALGASIVAVPDLRVPCTNDAAPTRPSETRTGTFGSVAAVDLSLSCGELAVTTQPGTAWRLDAHDGPDRRTDVAADAGRLTATSDGHARPVGLDAGHVEWDVVLPAGSTIDLTTQFNAGRGHLTLAGAHLGRLPMAVNAGDLRADLAGATLGRLDVTVNAASAAIVLPAATFEGSLDVNAGSLALCVPDHLGLRVRSTTALGSIDTGGLIGRNGAWETPGYATAPFKADLAIDASVGSVTIDPQGGCK